MKLRITVSKYHSWYFCQISLKIMLLFVYTTTHKRSVIFTCRYFKLGWNTTALSQSNCRNFSCSSIMQFIQPSCFEIDFEYHSELWKKYCVFTWRHGGHIGVPKQWTAAMLVFQTSLVGFDLRGGSRIFFRRGCTRLLLYFNTNTPHSFFFCRLPVVLENRRSV